jgi:hypothetical protein
MRPRKAERHHVENRVARPATSGKSARKAAEFISSRYQADSVPDFLPRDGYTPLQTRQSKKPIGEFFLTGNL